MEMTRKNGDITVCIDTKEEALGVFAVLTNQPGLVTEDQFKKGQFIYQTFFHNIEVLAHRWEEEHAYLYHDTKKRKGLL